MVINMKLGIITPGGLPVPATNGGAVETGIQQIIDENEQKNSLKIIVFSIYEEEAKKRSQLYKNTKFIFIKNTRLDKIDEFFKKSINYILRKLNFKFRFIVRKRYINKIINKIQDIREIDSLLIKNVPDYVLPIKRKIPIPIYLQIHNDFLNSCTYQAESISKLSDAIIVNSEFIKKRVLTINKELEKKLYINKNCVDTKMFYVPTIDTLRKLYNQKDIPWDTHVILYSGRLVKEKGVKELVEAFKIIANSNYRLIIMGNKWYSSKKKKDKYLNDLYDIIKPIKEMIIFTGYIPHNEVYQYYQLADLLIVPSMWEEPAGRIVQEAQSCGTTVISTDSGGIPEYLDRKYGKIITRDENFVKNLAKEINCFFSIHKSHEKNINLRQFACHLSKDFYFQDLINIFIEIKNKTKI